MLFESGERPVDGPVQATQGEGEVGGKVIAEDTMDRVTIKQDYIALSPVHFEDECMVITQQQGKTSFVGKLPDATDRLKDDFGEQVDAVLASSVEGGGERKALEIRLKADLDKKRSLAVIQLNDKFVFVLAETGDKGKSTEDTLKVAGKLTEEVMIVVHGLTARALP
jgi:hypothetical protein